MNNGTVVKDFKVYELENVIESLGVKPNDTIIIKSKVNNPHYISDDCKKIINCNDSELSILSLIGEEYIILHGYEHISNAMRLIRCINNDIPLFCMIIEHGEVKNKLKLHPVKYIKNNAINLEGLAIYPHDDIETMSKHISFLEFEDYKFFRRKKERRAT